MSEMSSETSARKPHAGRKYDHISSCSTTISGFSTAGRAPSGEPLGARLRLDQAQECAGVKDLDSHVASDRPQSFIAGYDRVGFEGDGATYELIVARVGLDDLELGRMGRKKDMMPPAYSGRIRPVILVQNGH